jgi:hypothetical protein
MPKIKIPAQALMKRDRGRRVDSCLPFQRAFVLFVNAIIVIGRYSRNIR